MNFKQYLTLVISFIFVLKISAQNAEISTQQTLGNEFHNFSYSILPLNDGGYIVLADTESDTSSMDYMIIKIFPDGEIDWQKNYGGEGVERPSQIIPDNEDGFYVIGSSSSKEGEYSNNHGSFDVWFAQFNFAGKLLWHKNYGGSGSDNGLDIWHKETGNFLIAGTTNSTDIDIEQNNGMSDIWLFEIDNEGNIIWDETYGGSDNEYFGGFYVDENDDIFIVGGTKSVDGDVSFNHGDKDVWLIKTNDEGELLNEKTFGGSDSDDGKIIKQSHTNNLIITSLTRSEDGDITKLFGMNDFWILEVNKSCELMWQRSYGGSKNDAPKDMLVTDDGYLIGGTTYSFDGNITENKGRSDVWMLKIYQNGIMNWQKTFGGSGVESCTKIVYAENANYLTANNTDSFDFDVENSIGNTDVWMLDYCETFFTKDDLKICQGDSVFWSGNYYSEDGVYNDSYESKCGLDSLKQLSLSVFDVPVLEAIEGPDLVVELSFQDYYANQIDNAVYYWDVVNGVLKDTTYLSNVTVQWQVPGNAKLTTYAVKNEICSSDTLYLGVYVSGVGVEENEKLENHIFPNPSSSGLFTVMGIEIDKIELYNNLGEKINSQTTITTNKAVVNISDKPKGIYFLRIYSGSEITISKLVHL